MNKLAIDFKLVCVLIKYTDDLEGTVKKVSDELILIDLKKN